MNSATLTTIVGLVLTAIGTIGWPMWVNRRKVKTAKVASQSLDSQSVAAMFKDERDRLQIRLDTAAIEHERQIRAARAEAASALAAAESAWRAQHEADQRQIAELREELHGLYRRLNRPPPGS